MPLSAIFGQRVKNRQSLLTKTKLIYSQLEICRNSSSVRELLRDWPANKSKFNSLLASNSYRRLAMTQPPGSNRVLLFCYRCGSLIPPQQAYCSKCGTPRDIARMDVVASDPHWVQNLLPKPTGSLTLSKELRNLLAILILVPILIFVVYQLWGWILLGATIWVLFTLVSRSGQNNPIYGKTLQDEGSDTKGYGIAYDMRPSDQWKPVDENREWEERQRSIWGEYPVWTLRGAEEHRREEEDRREEKERDREKRGYC